MSDVLVRIPLAAGSEFQPLALAPGLPMLDPRRLTWQVLRGWFGDLLAEPELDEKGVVFRAHQNGQRLTIVDATLATDRDLTGPLASDYDRLKKSLFDVRPVSPSEKLIFNRLQPPIGNHEGFLFRVRGIDGIDRLVWCWGYQRRNAEGRVCLCPNHACRVLFLHLTPEPEACPHCGHVMRLPVAEQRRRTRFPIGAVTAITALGLLAAGTYWFGAQPNDGSLDLIGDLSIDSLTAAMKPVEDRSEAGDELPGDAEPAASSGERTSDSTGSLTSLPEGTEPVVAVADRQNQAVDPVSELPEPGRPEFPDQSVPRVIDLPDPLASSGFEQDRPQSEPALANEVPLDSPSANETGTVRPIPQPAPLEPAEPRPGAIATLTPAPGAEPESSGASRTDSESSRPDKPSQAGLDPEPTTLVLRDAPRRDLATLSWHEDYLQGYHEAIQKHRLLLMVFRDLAEADRLERPASGLSDPAIRPLLDEFVRVAMPVNAIAPGATPDQPPTLLLHHRSFRHLSRQPGIVIVDLRDASSPSFGRVVSALPLPPDGQYPAEVLEKLLTLPAGGIGLRTLLLTARISLPGSSLATGQVSTQLNELATRAGRLAAQSKEAVESDRPQRLASITGSFGRDVRIDELHFATDQPATIQDAARQAVEAWLNNPVDQAALIAPSGSFGADMYQAPDGRWFATILIVRRP